MSAMTMYRAMCHEEAEASLAAQRPVFERRFKWFGTFEFVTGRVMDGSFNNSRYKPHRYERLLRFEITSGAERLCRKSDEWRLDRRQMPRVKWGRVSEVDAAEALEAIRG